MDKTLRKLTRAIPYIFLLCLYLLIFFLHFKVRNNSYQAEMIPIQQKEGRYVAAIVTECRSTCRVTILIYKKSTSSGAHEVLHYLKIGGEREAAMLSDYPDLTWLGENELEIAIDQVGKIVRQKFEVDGVKITYKIESVVYE